MSITTLLAGPSAGSYPHSSAAKECTEDPGVLIDSINSRSGPAGIVTETLAGTFATQASVAAALVLHKICTKLYMQLIDAASLPESHGGAMTPLIDAFGCCLWSLDAAGGARVRRGRPCTRTLRTASGGVGFWRYASP
jgi:hypothetical protein